MGGRSVAVLAATLMSLLLTSSPAVAQDAEAEARTAFERGVELTDSQRYPEAIREFRAAHRLVPIRPSPLYGIGVCLMELGGADNDREALESFDQFFDRSPDDPAQVRDARARVTTLLARLGMGTLELSISPEHAAATVDGEPVAPGRLDRVRLPAGDHLVEVSSEGYETQQRTVSVRPAETTEAAFSLPEAPAPADEPAPEQPVGTEPSLAEPAPDEPGPREERDQRPGIHQRWWFWTIIGAVVIGGAAVGLGLGLQNNVPDGDWRLDLP